MKGEESRGEERRGEEIKGKERKWKKRREKKRKDRRREGERKGNERGAEERKGKERKGKEKTAGLPDNLDEFTHVDMVWHQELGLVQDGKLFFSFIPLNNHLQETHTQSVNDSSPFILAGGILRRQSILCYF